MAIDQHITESEIRKELSRILKNPHFRSSKILTEFLKYIVSETLYGNEQTLKEYVIGTEVLKKGPDFNPQLDAIVRIHARRLRKLLEDYYSRQGVHDPIKISIPTGRYVPVFEKNDRESEVVAKKKGNFSSGPEAAVPRIAIVPLTKFNTNDHLEIICSTLCRDLSVELARFQELNVISNYSVLSAQKDLNGVEELIAKFSPDYLIITTCYLAGETYKSTIELHSVTKNQLIWAETFVFEDNKTGTIENYRSIIRKVISDTCGFFGFIYRDILLNEKIPQDYGYLYAIYWHNRFHQNFSEEAFREAFKAIEKGLANNPGNSLLNTLKAELLLNLKAMDIPYEVDVIREGMKLVNKAIALDQNNQHAWEMMSWVYILKHDRRKSIESINKCLSINPENPLYQASLGFGYICTAEYKKGWELLSKVILYPYYFWVANIGLCLYHLYERNFEESLYWARLIKKPNFLWDPLLRLSCMGHTGETDEIDSVKDELFDLSPEITSRIKSIVPVFLMDDDLQNRIFDGLKKAGLTIR